MDNFGFVAFGIIIVNFCLLTPSIVYCWCILKKYRDEATMQHRDYAVIIGINIICLFMLMIDRPILILHHIFNMIDTGWISLITSYISMCAMSTLFAVKGYCLFYRQKLNASRSRLQPNGNWYILHQNTFGNACYLMKIAVIFVIATLSAEIVIFLFTSSDIYYRKRSLLLFQSVIISLSMMVTSVILYKIRVLKDIYKIRNEVLLQFVMLLIIDIVYVVINLLCFFIPNLSQSQPRIIWMVIICFTNYPFFFMTLLNTMYPIYAARNTLRINTKVKALKVPDQSTTPSDIIRQTPMDMRLYLRFLSESRRFKSFMKYLIMEFACENLMFLKEYAEIKWHYQRQNAFRIKIPRRYLLIENRYTEKLIEGIQSAEVMPLKQHSNCDEIVIKLAEKTLVADPFYTVYLVETQSEIDISLTKLMTPKDLPQGAIMRTGTKDPLDLLRLLVCKYISIDGQHPLNIAWSLRKYIVNMFVTSVDDDTNVMSTDEMFCIFDECALEILTLIYSSFLRYCDSEYLSQDFDQFLQSEDEMVCDYDEMVCDDAHIQLSIIN